MFKNKKIIFCIILLFFITFCICFGGNIVSNAKKSISKQCVNIGRNFYNLKLYKFSNRFYLTSKKLNPNTSWIDYNIATNIRSEYWGTPLNEKMQQDLHIAIKYLDMENIKHPNNKYILQEYGYIYELLEEFDKSAVYYKKVLKMDSSNEYMLTRLSHLYAEKKFDYPQALVYLDKKTELSTNDYFLKAYILTALERYEEAVEYYKKYIERNPYHVAGFVNITLCEIELERYDDAEKHVNEGLKYAPGFSYLLNSKAIILYHKHHFEEAKNIELELIEKNKYDYDAYYNLAIFNKYEGKLEEAEKYFNLSKSMAQEYYDKFCINPYSIGDADGKCKNRYHFLTNFEHYKNKPLKKL